jgi:hypothetical protein
LRGMVGYRLSRQPVSRSRVWRFALAFEHTPPVGSLQCSTFECLTLALVVAARA